MSKIEVLPPIGPIDFHLSAFSNPRSAKKAGFNGVLSTSPTINTIRSDISNDNNAEDLCIPSLPPLLTGHPEVHLRNGVINATALSAAGEPDAEQAFFVADLSEVYKQHLRWKRCLPGVEPFYAVKCNPDPYVLRLLASLGAGFDCASNGEISQVLESTDIDPAKIIFANPCKAMSFIRSAAKAGVDMMTFDNADELAKIARGHPNAKLVVRILTDDSKSLCRLGLKFGAPMQTVPGLLLRAKQLGLSVVGVSFHVGSGSYDANAFADAVARARTAFDMGREAGFEFTLLDVGGGFEDATFEKNAAVLSHAIDLHFPRRDALRVIAEPGRFYVSRAFRLAAHVIARRAALEEHAGELMACGDDDVTEPRVMYYINDGVYGAFNCILFDHQTVHPYVLCLDGSFHVPASVPLGASSVWGPTCDSIDCVCTVTRLPVNLGVGDWLAFDNMGAYTICAASQFNGFERSNVLYTSGDGVASVEVRQALARYARVRVQG